MIEQEPAIEHTRTMAMMVLAMVFALCGGPTVFAQPAPFQHELVVEGFGLPSSGAFLPDGRMLIITLQGTVFITTPVDQRPVQYTEYLQVPNVNNTGEHGLMEVILDPGFATNNFIYLYYSTLNNRNRVSRFTHAGNSASPASETVIFETITPFSSCCHIGGGMAFVDNEHILLSVGDDFTPALAQDPASPYGKIHRFTRTGVIPTDNPYYDATPGNFNANGVLKSVYASGLRNPFRASFNASTGAYLVGEVGGNDHGVAWEDLHIAAPAANFGWPFCGDGGRTPQGACLDPLYSDPVFAYPHAGTGASITAGFTYTGTMFPPEWQGRYIYGDYARSSMRYLTLGPGGQVTSDNAFLNASAGGTFPRSIVKLLQGPDGAIYYIDLVSEFVTYTGGVHRIFYSPNRSPTCGTVSASPNDGPGPTLTTTLAATATDTEGDPLTYTWTRGDGTPTVTGATVGHTYSAPGTYFAQVVVSDGNSSIYCGAAQVKVGTPPFAQITSPGDGSTFRSGDVITFEGIGFDDDPLTEANYSWTAVFNHDDHIHPESGATGTSSFDLIVPTTGHGYSGLTYYTVTLTVTDVDGLQFSHSVQIFPEKVNVTITSTPPGLEVMVEGLPVLTPYTIDQAIGYGMQVAVMDGDQCLGSNGYSFAGWSNGQPQIQNYVVPTTNSTINASFNSTGACGTCGQFLSLDGVDDLVTFTPFALSGDFTIEFWQRPLPGFTSGDAVLGDATTNSLDLAGGKLRLFSNGTPRLISSVNMVANQWNHYAVVRSGGSLTVYVNGVIDAGAITAPLPEAFTVAFLGRGPFTGRYAGGLDELRIWTVARTPTQLQAFHQVEVAPGSAGLNAYWRFDQEAGDQVVQDLSPNLRQGLCGGSLLPEPTDPAFSATNGPMQFSCAREVEVTARVLLKGPYRSTDQLMLDGLRTNGVLPTTEPYTALGVPLTSGTGATLSAGVQTIAGPNAIVDWVVVELRNAASPAQVAQRIPAVLQRDGDIVAATGSGPLRFTVNAPTYHIAVKHRNHLGAMSAAPLSFAASTVTFDLTDPGVPTYGTNARETVLGKAALWAGDCNRDGVIRYAGLNNDRDIILSAIGGTVPTNVTFGYLGADVDLNGIIRYSGASNDRDPVLLSIGGVVPTAVRVQQLP